MKFVKSLLSFSLLAGVFAANAAWALPFNTDMYNPQPMTGSVMRPKAPDTIPLGALERRVATKEEAQKLQNPLKGDALSLASGRRLFAVNCSPCHGTYGNSGEHTPSWFAGQMGAPNLALPMYWDPAAGGEPGRSDGSVYGTIHLGGMAIMPAYGWKLSPTEHWDIINYLRSFQEAKKTSGTK